MFEVFDLTLFLRKLVFKVSVIVLKFVKLVIKVLNTSFEVYNNTLYLYVFFKYRDVVCSELMCSVNRVFLLFLYLFRGFFKGSDLLESYLVFRLVNKY